ncbi:xylulokinase [Blastococcus sp. SYSU DS0617]
MSDVWIGIDLGTSACKVLALGASGEVLTTATRRYPLNTPRPGWAEQEPNDWWEATDECVREVLGSLGGRFTVQGFGLCGQMHGLTALGAEHEVLRPVILWNDQRAAPQCEEITERAGGLPGLLELVQNRMIPGFTAGKILWLRENEPQTYARMRHVLNPKDYVRLRMTGELVTDVSDASGTGLFDVRARRWSTRLLELLDLPEDLLPRVAESTDVTGGLTAEIAQRWGVATGTPVVGGGGDAVLQTTSMGVVEEGVLGVTLGTAGVVGGAMTSCPPAPDGRLQISCGNAPDRWHVMGVALNSGGALQWLRDALQPLTPAAGLDYGRLVELAQQAPPGAQGLLFLPYLLGERCPHLAPEARGSWVGLTHAHTAAHLSRSVMEGVLLNLREVFDIQAAVGGRRAAQVRASGGATSEPLWTRLLADVLQTEVATVTGAVHGGAFGAAFLAGVGTGHWPSIESVADVVHVTGTTAPDPAVADVYADLHDVHRTLYEALRPAFASLAAVNLRDSA